MRTPTTTTTTPSSRFGEANRIEIVDAIKLSNTILSRRPSNRLVWAVDIGQVMWEAFAWLIRTEVTTKEETQEAIEMLGRPLR